MGQPGWLTASRQRPQGDLSCASIARRFWRPAQMAVLKRGCHDSAMVFARRAEHLRCLGSDFGRRVSNGRWV
ncbi:MAG: hypothetical protein EBX17_09650 [Betaproteobacteria bacterium]|nr:hypothetical protein [Betaproteobacteria bacterium]NDI22430.1 hypothetical protein [Betaproteobacteria bacterium]